MSSEQLNEENPDPNYVNNEYVKIPDWHMAIIEERMARYENADTSKWRTWEEVEKEFLEKLAKPLTD
ncbi:MAG TPA: addiction module protein [Pyrinomonadaceae bacterium]|jgi:putative addiction module component|nr:addiction module protein [Pyrinomonadaceae bacterium]